MSLPYSKSPTPHNENLASHGSRDIDSVISSRRVRAVREYIRSLPSIFDGDASPPLVDEVARMERELEQLDHDALKRTVLKSTQRCNDALHELLEQERLLSDALAEVRHLELQLRERDEDVEMLRVRLQASDDHVESLLHEKADALRKLTDAKNQLAHISIRAASLQRDLDARTKREKELADPLVSTPRITPANTTSTAVCSFPTTSLVQTVVACRTSVERDAKSHREPSHGSPFEMADSDPIPSQTGSAPTTKTAAAIARVGGSGRGRGRGVKTTLRATFNADSGVDVDLQKRIGHDGILCGRDARGIPLADSEDACRRICAKGILRSKSVEFPEWRKLFFESQRQNKLLEKELAKALTNNTGGNNAHGLLQCSKSQARTATHELQMRLRRSMTRLERVERELGVERERGRKQSQLETKLLKDIGRLARKLLAHENAKSALRVQQRADANLSREELLEELSRCRLVVGALTAARVDTSASACANDDNTNGNCTAAADEAGITVELAAALEEALEANETLRAEKESVLAEKNMREAAYEVELRNRIAEMDELTATLQDLRDQMKLLKRRRSLPTTHISSKENETGNRVLAPASAGREVQRGSGTAAAALQ